MKIALVDYGAGNLTSVRKGLEAAGADVIGATAPGDLATVVGIVIPGVGNFAATAKLTEPWRDAIMDRVEAGVPLFGICLGMQWLFDGSDEAPGVPGFGFLQGHCFRITAERPLKVPHVGWNELQIVRPGGILEGVPAGTQVYFTHSFAAPVTPACVASTTHGMTFASAVQREHVAGVQFHPEKSGDAGLRIIRNFLQLTRL